MLCCIRRTKQVEKNDEANGKAEQDTPKTEDKAHKAATKIQASFRGHITRKKLKGEKKGEPAAATTVEGDKKKEDPKKQMSKKQQMQLCLVQRQKHMRQRRQLAVLQQPPQLMGKRPQRKTWRKQRPLRQMKRPRLVRRMPRKQEVTQVRQLKVLHLPMSSPTKKRRRNKQRHLQLKQHQRPKPRQLIVAQHQTLRKKQNSLKVSNMKRLKVMEARMLRKMPEDASSPIPAMLSPLTCGSFPIWLKAGKFSSQTVWLNLNVLGVVMAF
uniref:Neuromodulin n=1 Tax=Callorhinchus milii TaxID=7868 RepID=A0A4W3HS32_CALMI|eukprot:gi/632969703/ref/XP_007901228.1/ PREDICTED: neuromodulin [Callorhinchus milii]